MTQPMPPPFTPTSPIAVEDQLTAATETFAREGFAQDGITVAILGDDGELVVGLGHHDETTFQAVAQAAWLEAFGVPLELDINGQIPDIRHRYASFGPENHETGAGWWLSWTGPDDQRPVPVTVLVTGF